MSARFVCVHASCGLGETPGSRVRLEREEDKKLIDLVYETVWPEQVHNPNSNHIRETHDALVLTTGDAKWLYEALGALLAATGPEHESEGDLAP